MSKYLKLIWFFEANWSKYHAAIGIKAEKTLCGIWRSTRTKTILLSERCKSYTAVSKCGKCRRILKTKYGDEYIVKIKIE